MDQSPQDPEERNSLDSLEDSATVVESDDNNNGVVEAPGLAQPPGEPLAPVQYGVKSQRLGNIRHLFQKFNIYLLMFVLVVVVAIVVVVVAYINSQNAPVDKPITATHSLSQSALDQLANSDVTVGDAKQVLSVESNAVFAGKVLVRDTLDVAGGLQVGGSLSLTGISVNGNSKFDDVQITKSLSVTGNTSLKGQLSIQNNINVNGSGTFNGTLSAMQLTTGSLQLNNDLILNHHIVAGGPTPSRSNGGALGSGGTASLSGSDTAGSVVINTGSSPAAGCFITVNFVQKFSSTPRVVITPTGSAGAALDYYVNRSNSNFSICTANAAPAGQRFGFDYIAFD